MPFISARSNRGLPGRFVVFVFVSLVFGLGNVNGQQFDNVQYDIEVRLNDIFNTLTGSTKISFVNSTGQDINLLYVHLYPNAYSTVRTAYARQQRALGNKDFELARPEQRGSIDSLDFRIDGETVPWRLDSENPDIAIIELPEPLTDGDELVIQTPFFVQIPESFSRLGHVAQSYQVSQWYPKLAMYDDEGWHPMPYLDLGEFYSEFATYSVSIELPENYIVAATGTLETESERQFLDSLANVANSPTFVFPESSERTKVLQYRAENVHDFAWFADKRFAVRKKTTQIGARDVDCWAFYTAVNAEKWERAPEYVERSLQFYSDLVGEYPYSAMTAVESPLSAGSGMEYPMITLIGDEISDFSLDRVITHEVGHNWFYGILASNERKFSWMDEGVNSYYEARYLREYYGPTTDDFLWVFGKRESTLSDPQLLLAYEHQRRRLQDPTLNPSQWTSDNYFYTAYLKPAYAFEMLERYMGREQFDRAMQSYYDEYKWKHPGPNDLREELEEECTCDLGWLFDDLVGSTAMPDYGIAEYVPGDQLLRLNNYDTTSPPVELIGRKGGEQVASMWIEGFKNDTSLRFACDGCDEIVIYHEDYTLDAAPRNNYARLKAEKVKPKPFKVTFLGGQTDPKYRLVNIAPVLAGNVYDGAMVGASISNLYLPPSKFTYSVTPLYATASNNLSGTAEFVYAYTPATRSRGGSIDRIEFGAQVKSFHYNKNEDYDFRDRYLKWAPSIAIDFRPSDLLSIHRHRLQYRFVRVCQWYGVGIDIEEGIWDREKRDYIVNELAYGYRNIDPVYPRQLDVELHQGKGFVRLAGRFEQKLSYRKRDKGVYLKAYAGWLPYYDEPDAVASFLFNGISSTGFFSNDFLYDELLFGRSEQSGFFSQQVFQKDAQLKTLYNGGISNDWMSSVGVAADFPFGLPLQVYFDAAAFPDPFGSGVQLSFSSGISVSLIRDAFEIYFPVFESSDITGSLTYEDRNFWQRISFLMDFNAIKPRKLIRDYLD